MRNIYCSKNGGKGLKIDTERKYFYSINAAKLFFVCVVVCYHTGLLDGVMDHAYLAVEFFFIVSGFFLARRASGEEKKVCNVKKYLQDRFYKLYPHYVFSLVIMLLVSIGIGVYVKDDYNIIAEIFLVQSLGFTRGGYKLSLLVYISSFLGATSILYSFIVRREKGGKDCLYSICNNFLFMG